jgi:hypothetical protein
VSWQNHGAFFGSTQTDTEKSVLNVLIDPLAHAAT